MYNSIVLLIYNIMSLIILILIFLGLMAITPYFGIAFLLWVVYVNFIE